MADVSSGPVDEVTSELELRFGKDRTSFETERRNEVRGPGDPLAAQDHRVRLRRGSAADVAKEAAGAYDALVSVDAAYHFGDVSTSGSRAPSPSVRPSVVSSRRSTARDSRSSSSR